MIVTRLAGGLGNQLFQYATGLALARRLDSSLFVDTRLLKLDEQRLFGLDEFGIEPTEEENLPAWIPPIKRASPKFWVWKLGTGRKVLYVRENKGRGWSALTDPQRRETKEIYLHGYWQSESYFADQANAVREAFQFRSKPTSINAEFLDRIRDGTAISVHVRRGDYTSKVNQQIYATCSDDYYRRAIETIAEREKGPVHAFLFSDDPEWVAANMKINVPFSIVNHNQKSPVDDLRLMAACRHHVIANSTFSWWGAWLASPHDQIVVAPKRWFVNDAVAESRLIPERWLRVD